MARQAGKDSIETKLMILDEAILLFERNGYQNTSMRMVKEQTQLSKGTLYYHYQNKEDLFLACIKKIYEDALSTWEETQKEEATAIEKLYLWADLGIKEMKRPIIQSLLEYAREAENKEDRIQELLQIELGLITSLLDEGVQNGEFKEDLTIHDTGVILLNHLTLSYDASLYGYQTVEEQKKLVMDSICLLLEGIKK